MKRYRPGTKPKYPIATLALYGPDDKHATKTVVGIVKHDGGDVEDLHRWISPQIDIRQDSGLQKEIADFMRQHNVKMVVTTDRILGCPHEEGKDYPEGESCPMCPFWENRDRWSEENNS